MADPRPLAGGVEPRLDLGLRAADPEICRAENVVGPAGVMVDIQDFLRVLDGQFGFVRGQRRHSHIQVRVGVRGIFRERLLQGPERLRGRAGAVIVPADVREPDEFVFAAFLAGHQKQRNANS